MKRNKAIIPCHAVWQEVIDAGGRYATDWEFNWILDSFKDRYNPSRLALIMARSCDLRLGRVVGVRFKDLTEDLKRTRCSNNKPSKRIDKKSGLVRIKTKPSDQPLPDNLIKDLHDYIRYRLKIGAYCNEDLGDVSDIANMRLFPGLTMQKVRNWFEKMRIRHAIPHKEDCPKDCRWHEQYWLKDVWCILHYLDKDGNEIKQQKMYRVAPYETRAYFVTANYEESNFDIRATQLAANHEKVTTTMRYTRRKNMEDLKQKVKRRLEALYPAQPTPLLVGQKTLFHYGK